MPDAVLSATLFAGAGEMRERCRTFDWGATPLGPVEDWPHSLRTVASLLLGSAFPKILLWGPQLVQLYNDGYVPLLGVKHPWGLGRPTRDVWPEAWAFNEPIYSRVLRGDTVALVDQLYRLQRRGPDLPADEVYLTISYSPVTDDDGSVGGVLVTLIDTTEAVHGRRAQQAIEQQNVQLEEQQVELELTNQQLQENATELEAQTLALEEANAELRLAEGRLQRIFQKAPAFLAVLRGRAHVFEFVNEAYYSLVGRRELVGRRLVDALPEVKDQGFVDILDRVLETGEPFVGREIPVRITRTADAPLEEVFVDFIYQPLRDTSGAVVGIVAHGSDVTAQVRARREVERLLAESERSAAALRASEQRLRDVVEQAPVAVAVMEGPDHVYTVASPRYRLATGGSRELVGRSVREIFPELRGQGFVEILDRVYESGEPFAASERIVQLDRDGDGVLETYFFNVGYQPLRDADGRVYAIASVSHDVTDQVRARRELELARAEAEEANRAKSQFLATMSHELRTPLNAIGGYADLLLLGVRGELTEGQREDVERMKRSGQHLLSLINDILNFAKLEAGQVEFHREAVPVAQLTSEVEDLIRPQVGAKRQRFSRTLCDPSLSVEADPEKLRQVLLNLLANAVKFTDEGGAITLSCDVEGDRVIVRVSDTGRGIATEQLARIFEPFVQVDRHLTHESQQGVGLGLAISHDLVRGMGGELTARSERGKGSTFTVALPRAAAHRDPEHS